MGLRTKFNLVMFLALAVGLVLAAQLTHNLLQKNARQEVELNATMLMEAAKGIRTYTADEISSLLKSSDKFLPQSIPAYAATQNMKFLHQNFPDFVYKEAALNPTNPEHRATDWESEVIQYFRNNPDLPQYAGVRETPQGQTLFLSRPFRLTNPQCLVCHSKPENAPPSMVAMYGPYNGFGWKLGDVIGAQIVSVPMTVPMQRADATFKTFMIVLVGVFLLVWLLLNVFLHLLVVRPLKRMSQSATQVSLGDLSVPEFDAHGKDEVSSLGRSFNRMYRSLASAAELLDSGRV